MFIEILIVGILIGGFQSGRLSNLTDMNIRGWYLILVSIVLSMLPVFLNGMEAIATTQVQLMFASMVVMVLVVVLNLDKKGVWLILLGGLFNIALMLMNGMKMPVMMETLDSAGLTALYQGITDGSIVNYVASDAEGIMRIFTKFIPIPKPYPLPKILSIGDIMMSIGLLMMIIGEMKKPSYMGRGKMVSYTYGSSYKRR